MQNKNKVQKRQTEKKDTMVVIDRNTGMIEVTPDSPNVDVQVVHDYFHGIETKDIRRGAWIDAKYEIMHVKNETHNSRDGMGKDEITRVFVRYEISTHLATVSFIVFNHTINGRVERLTLQRDQAVPSIGCGKMMNDLVLETVAVEAQEGELLFGAETTDIDSWANLRIKRASLSSHQAARLASIEGQTFSHPAGVHTVAFGESGAGVDTNHHEHYQGNTLGGMVNYLDKDIVTFNGKKPLVFPAYWVPATDADQDGGCECRAFHDPLAQKDIVLRKVDPLPCFPLSAPQLSTSVTKLEKIIHNKFGNKPLFVSMESFSNDDTADPKKPLILSEAIEEYGLNWAYTIRAKDKTYSGAQETGIDIIKGLNSSSV